jgi:hypothetical protein
MAYELQTLGGLGGVEAAPPLQPASTIVPSVPTFDGPLLLLAILGGVIVGGVAMWIYQRSSS